METKWLSGSKYFLMQGKSRLKSKPQLSLETRMEDWTSLGQHKRKPGFPVVTRESRRTLRKTTWVPRHPKMRPLPSTACQEKPQVRIEVQNGTWHPWSDPKSFPTHRSHSRGTPRFPARLQLSPFTPPDRDKMVDSPALSGRGSRSSWRTSGWHQSNEEIRDVASWMVPRSERPRFPALLLIRTRCPDTSLLHWLHFKCSVITYT